jgi:hypothetical protein
VVDEVTVTFLVEVFFVCGFVTLTVIVSPLTAVTSPLVGAVKFPDGPEPFAAEGMPLGISLGRDAEPEPPPLGAPPPPNPVVQLPSTAAVMLTEVMPAAELDDEELELDVLGIDEAVMHEPTVTSESEAVAFVRMLVLEL